jgi:hypothetical protein
MRLKQCMYVSVVRGRRSPATRPDARIEGAAHPWGARPAFRRVRWGSAGRPASPPGAHGGGGAVTGGADVKSTASGGRPSCRGVVEKRGPPDRRSEGPVVERRENPKARRRARVRPTPARPVGGRRRLRGARPTAHGCAARHRRRGHRGAHAAPRSAARCGAGPARWSRAPVVERPRSTPPPARPGGPWAGGAGRPTRGGWGVSLPSQQGRPEAGRGIKRLLPSETLAPPCSEEKTALLNSTSESMT